MTDQEWNYGISANLTGAFYCARALSKQMVDRGWGRIINIASQYAFRGGRNMFTYTSGKGGIVQLTRSLALSLGPNGVTSNTVSPAFIPTEVDDSKRSSPAPNPMFTPMGKFPAPSDLGPLVVFLASQASGYLNGGNINVDGASMAGGFAPNGFSPSYDEELT
jgi:NAD(P)-dependent dehydrogenase (short-subunit alcohol dehydrogenase family)